MNKILVVVYLTVQTVASSPFDISPRQIYSFLFATTYLIYYTSSVTRKKSSNVYKSCPKMISLEKWKILTPLHKLPKNVRDLGKLIVAKGFKKLPKVQKIVQSGHTGPRFKSNHTIYASSIYGQILYYVWHCVEKRTKINKKGAEFRPFSKKVIWTIIATAITANFCTRFQLIQVKRLVPVRSLLLKCCLRFKIVPLVSLDSWQRIHRSFVRALSFESWNLFRNSTLGRIS